MYAGAEGMRMSTETDDELFYQEVERAAMAISQERAVLAFSRALKKLSIPFEWDDEGRLEVRYDGPEDLEELCEGEEFKKAYGLELQEMAIQDIQRELVAAGVLKVDGVDSQGNVVHTLTDESLH
jgi:hypothetical protein